ncbi:CGI-121-domain-containing protein [Lindgomyces ingoldianus]|uniref:CGI-121-domain-containing protein n=1 Tax=Lindgomyces ingoldianus TaxID=673940 RepID=A0ACB6QPS3_9PLEO|nr:CGI-121-domain-containing protein [Lindgomyces ingoldianus]KAF2469024.1 CGI-121-domain-containing protein [Lindgomyces ingoldianus]
MAAVQTFYLPHYPTYPIHVCMFKDVSNAAHLRSQLLEANPEFDFAFLDATMILSPNHLLSASFLALHAHLTSRSKTRTPHSELVFRLHPNNNIGESYRKFGLSDSTTHIVAVKLSLSPSVTAEAVSRHLSQHIEGTSVEIGEGGEGMGMWADREKISKIYKLDVTTDRSGKKGRKEKVVNGDVGREGDEVKEMEMVILGIMTTKGS